ncbi:MAG: glycosyltransferase [Chloroflexi bacterium]|nr:glycosyltransferase [Chloroflexota bacterium]
MARILMLTVSVPGHVNTGLPLARKLVERGHEVRWYTSPRFQRKIEATGARFLPFQRGDDFDTEEFPERAQLQGMAALKWDIRMMIDTSVDYVADGMEILETYHADLILADSAMLAGSFLSEKSDLPYAVYHPFPLTISSQDTAPFGPGLPPSTSFLGRLRNRLLNWFIFRVVLRDTNRYANEARAKLDLPPMPETYFDAMVRRCDLTMVATTPIFEYPRNDLPEHIHFIGPLLPQLDAEFTSPSWWSELQSDRPVILVTQGTVENDLDNLLLPTIKALANEDVLVIATTGNKSVDSISPDSIPANVRLEQFIPFAHLLPHVDVMITNGGYGGAQFALAHGVPLVASGRTEDKPEVCARIAWAEAGINLKAKSVKPEQVKRAVRTILQDPSYKQNAERIQEDFAKWDAPAKAVEMLEALLGTRKPVYRATPVPDRPSNVMAALPEGFTA